MTSKNSDKQASINSIPHPFQDVQPILRGSFFCEDTDKKLAGTWPVFLTDYAIKKISKLGDNSLKTIVLKKIRELGEGHFSNSNAKRVNERRNDDVAVFEAKLSRNLRLLWQVGLSEEEHGLAQILVICSVESHDSMDAKRHTVEQFVVSRGPQYTKLCEARIGSQSGRSDVFLPQTWPFSEYTNPALSVIPSEQSQDLTDQEKLDAHERLSLSKLVMFDKELLASIIADDTGAIHAFKVSPQEEEVIDHPGASLVIGRSGSGKTTILVYKMIALERYFLNHPTVFPSHLCRQIFITQGSLLRSRVKEHYDGSMRSAELSGKRLVELQEIAASGALGEKPDLTSDELEEGVEQYAGKKLSDLREGEYPLFLSYDGLLDLLERELGLNYQAPIDKKHRGSLIDTANLASSSSIARLMGNLHLIDFVTFEAWWKGFDQSLTKGLDATAVWSEILGVIKGSARLADKEKGWLDEEEYINLSERAGATFLGRREKIYSIFKAYQAKRAKEGMYDRADRTHGIVNALRKRSERRDLQVAFLSVDEAQDLLMLDFSLLRIICPNPSGVTIVGDTAQTISEGSSFRFQELSASYYVLEEGLADQEGRRPFHLSQFQLTRNYRSHRGITNCANAIVHAIVRLFPSSIDRLEDETSISDGPRPLWISKNTVDNFAAFLSAGSNVKIEFGAKHCIIVRDEAGRKSVRDQLGKEGLVLTIFESKGLEFESVLIWDFLEHSPASASCWRVLDNVAPRRDQTAPVFDHIKHAALKKELQKLYVAVTRARKTVWIWSSEKDGPLPNYLEACGAVRISLPGEPLPKLASSSTSEDWEELGTSLSNRQIHTEAALAFVNAGLQWKHDLELARAALQRASQKSRAYGLKSSLAKEGFSIAGRLFSTVAQGAKTVQAAQKCHQRAAECLQQAEDFLGAAKEFELAEKFDLSAVSYRVGGDFDEAIRVIKNHRQSIPSSTWKPIVEVAKVEYSRRGELEKGVTLFESSDKYLDFLHAFGFTDSAKTLLIKLADFSAAAKIASDEGGFVEAAALFARAGKHTQAVEQIRSALWTLLPNGGLNSRLRRFGLNLLAHDSIKLSTTNSSKKDAELAFFTEILAGEATASEFFGLAKSFRHSDSHCLLALEAGLAKIQDHLHAVKIPQLLEYLHAMRQSTKLIRKWVNYDHGSFDFTSSTLHRILGVVPVVEDDDDEVEHVGRSLRILSSSPFAHLVDGTTSTEGGRLPTVVDAAVVHQEACKYFHTKVFRSFRHLSTALETHPLIHQMCPSYLWTGHCTKERCELPHGGRELRSQQVAVILELAEMMRSVEWLFRPRFENIESGKGKEMQRIWCERLVVEALPPFLGSAPGDLETLLGLNGWSRAKSILAAYSQERLWELKGGHLHSRYFLPSFLASAFLTYDLLPGRLENMYGRLPMRLSIALPFSLLTNRGASLPFLLCYGLSRLSSGQVAMSALETILEFGEYVIERELGVDIGSFLAIVEEVVMLLAVWGRHSYYRAPLWHGAVLPRKSAEGFMRRHLAWLVSGGLQGHHNIISRVLNILFEIVKALSRSQDSYLRHDGKLIFIKDFVRHIFIYRSLRMIALVGVNVPFSQGDIIRGFSILSRLYQWKSPLYRNLLRARTWSAVEQSLVGSPSDSGDSIIGLVLQGNALPVLPRGVSHVRGSSILSIYTILVPTSSNLSPSAPSFQPKKASSSDTATNETIPDQEESVPLEHVKAAKTIQRYVRSYLRNCNSHLSRKPHAVAFRKSAKEFNDAAKALPNNLNCVGLRQKWLRGFMVDLHFALEQSRKVCAAKKQKLHLEMAKVFHQELEKVMEDLNDTSAIMKRLDAIKRNTSPKSHPLSKNSSMDVVLRQLLTQLSPLPALVQDLTTYLEDTGKPDMGSDARAHFEIVLVGLAAGERATRRVC